MLWRNISIETRTRLVACIGLGAVALTSNAQIELSGPISLQVANVLLSGTNGTPGADYAVLRATNVVPPLSNWVSLFTNQFNGSGGFSFTNANVPGIPQRFFQLRTP